MYIGNLHGVMVNKFGVQIEGHDLHLFPAKTL